MTVLPLLAALAFVSAPVSATDPNNGYEDYVRAGAMLSQGDFGALAGWTAKEYQSLLESKKSSPGDWTKEDEENLQRAKELAAADYLGIQKRMVDEYGRVLDIVKAGNEKPVWDSSRDADPDALFPQYATFKSIAKLFNAGAYVRFAEGNARAATTDLLAGYTFSLRIGSFNLLSELVSVSCRSIVLASFNQNIGKVSDRDAQQIIGYVDAALAEPSTFAAALSHERDQSIARMTKVFDQSMDQLPVGAQDLFAKMTPKELDFARQFLKQSLGEMYAKVIGETNGDESGWITDVADDGPTKSPSQIRTVQDLTDSLSESFLPLFRQATVAELKARTQLRLLGLHARIVDFRWKNNRLPGDLKEAVPEKLISDPMSHEAFRYELVGEGYRLYSKGVKSTGPIELKYRKTPVDEIDGPIPPR